MTGVVVRGMLPADATQWDAFIASCTEATFFHRSGWKDIIEACFAHHTHYLLAEAQGAIQGILPLAQTRHPLFGHTLSSLPFCVYGGIAAENETARTLLDQSAQTLARELGVDYLEYRQRESYHADWPSKDLYVTFRKVMDPDPEQNMKNIPRKQRAMVRSGIKHGLMSTVDDGVDRFCGVFSDNMLRHGTPALPKK